MKKTLVAVAAMVAVTGAMAEVSITGNIDQAITNIKTTTAGATDYSVTGLMAAATPSFVTFSGSEDLGNGLKASFKFENGLGINSGNLLANNGTFADSYTDANWNNVSSGNREAWAGISGDFGNVQLGTQYTPVFNTSAGTDPNGVNNIAGWSPFLVIFGNSAGYSSNAVTYTSPSVNGITLQLQQTYGVADTYSTSAGDGNGWSINYASGPLTVGYAQNQKTQTAAGTLYGPAVNGNANGAGTADGDNLKVTVAAATYDLGVAKVTYLNTEATLVDDKVKVDTFGVSLPAGAFSFGYTYSNSTTTASSVDTKVTGQQLTVSYSLSKRTTAYFAYGQSKNTTDDNSTTATAFGVRHAF